MTPEELEQIASTGEDGKHEFKSTVKNADSLASEIAAFANSEGGMVLIGIKDNGEIIGLSKEDVGRVNQLISNTASQHIRSPLSVQTKNILLENKQVVICIKVPKGIDKPYFDRSGVIWFKCGADKRRINSKEELRRLFQESDQFHADELSTKALLSDLDRELLREFLRNKYRVGIPDSPEEYLSLLENLNIATSEGRLTLAGVLMFSKNPQRFRPQFMVKAATFPGLDIHVSDYKDMEDITGTLPKMFADAKAFVMRQLHKIQDGRGVNSCGKPEIPEIVIEELLVNAFVHRDYLVSAPIRIFVFDDRVEIISPGHLTNSLTVDKIKFGNANSRNPILLSLVAQGLLPYRGLGSGIRRVLKESPNVSFADDHDGCTFKCTIPRIKTQKEAVLTDKGAKTLNKGAFSDQHKEEDEPLSLVQQMIVSEIKKNPKTSYKELAEIVKKNRSTITRNIQKLKELGLVQHVGSKKTGYWKVIDR